MGGVDARTPAGTVWTGRRRWLPHREGSGVEQRLRTDRTEGGLEVLELPIDLDLGIAGLVIGIVVFVALGIVLIFGWPLILLGLDLAWLIVVAGVGAIARLVLRRPWRVEAVAGGERRAVVRPGLSRRRPPPGRGRTAVRTRPRSGKRS